MSQRVDFELYEHFRGKGAAVAVDVVYNNGSSAGPVVQFVLGGKTPLVNCGEDIVAGGYDSILGLHGSIIPNFLFHSGQIVRLDTVLRDFADIEAHGHDCNGEEHVNMPVNQARIDILSAQRNFFRIFDFRRLFLIYTGDCPISDLHKAESVILTDARMEYAVIKEGSFHTGTTLPMPMRI